MQKRVVMISGANRGIGLVIAKLLYTEGYYLSLGLRNNTAIELFDVADKHRLYSAYYDATKNTTADSWVKSTLQQYGQIDILINCAGILRFCNIEKYDESILDELWTVNTKAPIYLTHMAWEYLKKSGTGRVINIVSLAGKKTEVDHFGYSLSKHALLAFTHAIRQAGWKSGIRATAICPGWVNTDMADGECQLAPETITQPEDIATIVKTLLLLPNTASIAELPINGECTAFF